MILISACLVGVNCRYDCTNNCDPALQKLVEEGKAIPVCPEQLGGCATPRLSAEIVGGDGRSVLRGEAVVLDQSGQDVTENFVRGAYEVLKISRLVKAKAAILKANSPSCGYGLIYDGTFTNKLKRGHGVTSALLHKEGLTIFNENDYGNWEKK